MHAILVFIKQTFLLFVLAPGFLTNMKWILVHRIHFKFVNWNKIKAGKHRQNERCNQNKSHEMAVKCGIREWEKSSAGGKLQDVSQMCVLLKFYFVSHSGWQLVNASSYIARDWYVNATTCRFSACEIFGQCRLDRFDIFLTFPCNVRLWIRLM